VDGDAFCTWLEQKSRRQGTDEHDVLVGRSTLHGGMVSAHDYTGHMVENNQDAFVSLQQCADDSWEFRAISRGPRLNVQLAPGKGCFRQPCYVKVNIFVIPPAQSHFPPAFLQLCLSRSRVQLTSSQQPGREARTLGKASGPDEFVEEFAVDIAMVEASAQKAAENLQKRFAEDIDEKSWARDRFELESGKHVEVIKRIRDFLMDDDHMNAYSKAQIRDKVLRIIKEGADEMDTTVQDLHARITAKRARVWWRPNPQTVNSDSDTEAPEQQVAWALELNENRGVAPQEVPQESRHFKSAPPPEAPAPQEAPQEAPLPQHPSSSDTSSLPNGTRIQVKGFENRSELNSRTGTVQWFDSQRNRYLIRFDPDTDSDDVSAALIRRNNLIQRANHWFGLADGGETGTKGCLNAQGWSQGTPLPCLCFFSIYTAAACEGAARMCYGRRLQPERLCRLSGNCNSTSRRVPCPKP